MEKIRFAVVGNGWRAMFFVRAAQNLPERFELTGVLCRSQEKAEAFARAHGVRAFWNMDDLLETKPDFVVSCLTKKAMPDATVQLLERGVHVLSETPLAVDLDTLEKVRSAQKTSGAVLSMAEQYFLYPGHQARLEIMRRGLIGQVQNVWMSMMHDYHGISMLRAYLGEESGPVTIRARKVLKDLEAKKGSKISVKEKDKVKDLFSAPIVQEIKMTDPDKLTPMGALQLIAEWKKRVDDE